MCVCQYVTLLLFGEGPSFLTRAKRAADLAALTRAKLATGLTATKASDRCPLEQRRVIAYRAPGEPAAGRVGQ